MQIGSYQKLLQKPQGSFQRFLALKPCLNFLAYRKHFLACVVGFDCIRNFACNVFIKMCCHRINWDTRNGLFFESHHSFLLFRRNQVKETEERISLANDTMLNLVMAS